MKKVNYFLLTFLCLVQLLLFSQNTIPYDSLEGNNIKMRVYADGYLGHNVEGGASAFIVPSDTLKSTIYAMDLWIAGYDAVTKELKLMENTFRDGCLFGLPNNSFNGIGPVATTYSSSYESKYKRVWKISKADIDYHKQNAGTFNYTIIDVIQNWPAHGDTSNGEAFNLAPFVDWNQDGIYTPEFGDYPCIKGDQAVYTISNDANPDTCYSWDAFPLEIHQMSYSFNTNNALNNTVFIEYKIVNRGNNDLEDFYVGKWIDFDIGGYEDDYVGCDTLLNVFYGYNGDHFDEDRGGAYGYKGDPPFCGAVFLNEPMTSFMTYYRGGDTTRGDAVAKKHFHNFLKARWKDSTHLKYGGNGHYLDSNATNQNTNYFYPADPRDTVEWNENTTGNQPFDRRGIGSTGPFYIKSGQSIEIALAIVTTQDKSKNFNWDVFDTFKADVNFVQDYYDNNIHYCQNWTTGENETKLESAISIFPNPAKSQLNIENTLNQAIQLRMYNLLGSELLSIRLSADRSHQIDVSSLKRGFYLVQLNDGKKLISKKVLLE